MARLWLSSSYAAGGRREGPVLGHASTCLARALVSSVVVVAVVPFFVLGGLGFGV